MTPSSAAARGAITHSTPPDFAALVELRRQWRAFHEKQDRENADRIFLYAGIDLLTEGDLRAFPADFREKLGEFGRDWERVLAARALREGYAFYRIRLTLAIDEVNAFHAWLERAIEGKGAALIFESDGPGALHDGVWDASFSFTLRPDESPDALALGRGPGIRNAGQITRIACD